MASVLAERLEIFRHRPYLLYFLGTTVSMMGTGMQFIANSWLALELTGRSQSVAFVLVFSALPGILLSPFIGVYVDRLDRRWLALLMDVARGFVLLAVPALFSLGLLRPWHLYLMAFLVAVGDRVYSPSTMALIREVVPRDQLLYANSTTSISNQIGSLVGAGLGGLIIAFYSPMAVMFVNAASFFVSAAAIYSMRSVTVVPVARAQKGSGLKAFTREMAEGFDYIREHPHITVCYVLMLFLLMSLRTINVLLAPFAKDVLQVGVRGFGYIDAAFAVGAIVGNLLLPPLVRAWGATRNMTVGMFLLAASQLVFALSRNLWMGMLGYFLIGVTFQVRILYLTRAQESVDVGYQGRVDSSFNTLIAAVSLLTYLAMGYLGELVSMRWLYGFQAATVAVAGVAAYYLVDRRESQHAGS